MSEAELEEIVARAIHDATLDVRKGIALAASVAGLAVSPPGFLDFDKKDPLMREVVLLEARAAIKALRAAGLMGVEL